MKMIIRAVISDESVSNRVTVVENANIKTRKPKRNLVKYR